MNLTLVPVQKSEKEILRNLMEKYDYEFSQYDRRDVNELGLFGYDWLDCYWTEEKRHAFFIKADEKLAGFVMVCDCSETREPCDYGIAEFFVMYKYRRLGVGSFAARSVWDLFHGSWQLKLHPKNETSVQFWQKTVSSYTNGNFRLVQACPGTEYDDGTPGDIYFFET